MLYISCSGPSPVLCLTSQSLFSANIHKMPGFTHEQPPKDNLQILVKSLTEKLGPCSGIDSDDVDAEELQQLMEDYVSDRSDWEKYFFPASNMNYTRNLVDKGNGKSNLVCIE